MLNKAAITAFLNRDLGSSDWIKEHEHPTLDAELAAMRPVPDFSTFVFPPWLHQKAGFLLLNELKRFLLFVDMGGGKSLTTLMLLKYRKQCGERIKAVVFVPYITSVETWVEEAEKHAPDMTCVPLLGKADQNLASLQNGNADLYVICYQTAVAMLARSVGAKRTGKWNFQAKDVRKCFAGVNALVMDEIHKVKNQQSLTYRMCRAISAQSDYAVGLTGTPFGRDLQDLWAQFYVIDFGDTLGETLGLYRGVFFDTKVNFWGGFDYKFNRKMLPKLTQVIKNRSLRYEITELHDLPPRNYITRKLKAPDDTLGYSKDAAAKLKEAQRKGDLTDVESNYLKLRQLSSGYMTLRGENNNKLQVKFKDNPKLDALTAIIDSLPTDAKIVIFHHFVYTNLLLSEALTKLGVEHARIWSGQRDPIGELRRFKNNKKCRALIINSKSGSSSLNLQHANFMVFFEQPDSAIDRQQAERRVWRPGQDNPVFIFDLLVDETVDARMRSANIAGKNLLKELFREIKMRQPGKTHGKD